MAAEQPPIRVLLVDDEEYYRAAVCRVLGRRGFCVTEAASGEEALTALAAGAPDAVVLDLNLPGIDGLETLRRIAEALPSVPVIMLTGRGTMTAARDAIRHRVRDFLLKPVSVERLVEALEAAVAGQRGGG